MFHEIPLTKIQQSLLLRLDRVQQMEVFERIGRIDLETWVEHETAETCLKFVHSLYGREVEKIIIPAATVKKSFFRRLFEKMVSGLLPFVKFSEEKIVRDEIVIALNQFFPKLVVPDGDTSQPLFLAAATVGENGQQTVGHCEVDAEKFITSTKNHTRKKPSVQIHLEGENKTPFWKWGK